MKIPPWTFQNYYLMHEAQLTRGQIHEIGNYEYNWVVQVLRVLDRLKLYFLGVLKQAVGLRKQILWSYFSTDFYKIDTWEQGT